MNTVLEAAPIQFDWPREYARRSLDRQKDAFKTTTTERAAFPTPRVSEDRLWLGDSSLLHDLGWWWLTTLRLTRTLVSMRYTTLSEVFAEMDVFAELAEEAFAPVEEKLVAPYQVKLFIERLYDGMSASARTISAERPLPDLIRALEHELTVEAAADLRSVLTEAEEHIRRGTFAHRTEDVIVQLLATRTGELLAELDKERRRAEALRAFMPKPQGKSAPGDTSVK